jgi:hypothetical protein
MPNCERDRDNQEIPYPHGEAAEIGETAAS